MCDEFIHPGLVTDSRLSRRSFGLMTVATAGLATAPALAQSNVAEKDVTVKTADGSCDAALFHPTGQGSWPAVLVLRGTLIVTRWSEPTVRTSEMSLLGSTVRSAALPVISSRRVPAGKLVRTLRWSGAILGASSADVLAVADDEPGVHRHHHLS